MPAALASVGRQLIVMLVQTGAILAVQEGLKWFVDKLILWNKDENDLSDEDATTQTANSVIEIAALAGITMLSLRTKLPVKIAERLGFTSKGFAKRALSKAGAAKLASKGVVTITANATKAEVATEIATVVAKNKGFSFATVSKIANVVVAVIGVPVGVGLLVVNTIDFAAWPSSSYQDTFQKFFSFFGMNPDAQTKNSKVISEDMWKRIYATFQTLGAIGINDPYAGVDKPFTRENLILIVDKVAAEIIKEKGSATFKEVFGATQAFVVMKEPVTNDKIANAFKGTAVASAVASQTTTIPSITKVFTGIVSQGVVGQGLVFTARPDDLIESAEELRQAAANNLAPYLNTLLGKIVYEVKVVASIITKEGFKQSGTTQRIQTGTYSNGTPKYKSVTNKFATLVVYALTDKGSRAKLTTIVLGPVDSAKLIVGQNDLRTLETELPALVTTTDINDINEIKTDTTTVVSPKTEQETTPIINTTSLWWVVIEVQGESYKVGPFTNREATVVAYNNITEQYKNINVAIKGYPINGAEPSFSTWLGVNQTEAIKSTSVSGTTVVDSNVTPATTKTGTNTTTLSMWYQTQGQSGPRVGSQNAQSVAEFFDPNKVNYPSVSIRSKIYAELGLGQASFYTGTSEQNTKLLSALKAQ